MTAFLCTIFLVVGYISFRYVQTFTRSAQVTAPEMVTILKNGLRQNLFVDSPNLNLVFFGLDQVGNSRENSLLTDTILFVSIKAGGKITIIPIPRDLWIDPLKTKINALYFYGENDPDLSGIKLATKTISEITAVPIDHTIVLDLDTVKHIIDTVGGVDVMVDTAFTDSQFPRDDVNPDILPVSDRYKTISFTAGFQHMDGTRALEYIRSRKSQNALENTDESRSGRQQKVIAALTMKLTDKDTLVHPYLYGQLYLLWHKEIKSSLNDQDIVALAKYYVLQKPSMSTIPIPVKTATTSGVIYNPPLKKHKVWVWEPTDPNWEGFAQFFHATLQP